MVSRVDDSSFHFPRPGGKAELRFLIIFIGTPPFSYHYHSENCLFYFSLFTVYRSQTFPFTRCLWVSFNQWTYVQNILGRLGTKLNGSDSDVIYNYKMQTAIQKLDFEPMVQEEW